MIIGYLLIAFIVAVAIYLLTLVTRGQAQRDDVVSLIRAVDREEAKKGRRVPPSPILLSQPFGEAEWKKLEGLLRDARYRQAIASIKARYSVVSNPMLLPNALKETMQRRRVDLAEAVVILADAPQDHRVG